MSGDGVQNHIPVCLYRGTPSGSSETAALDAGYDWIITRIFAVNGGSGASTELYLQDDDGHTFFIRNLAPFSTAGETIDESGLSIVLPAAASFSLNGAAGLTQWSIDGLQIAPAASSILPT